MRGGYVQRDSLHDFLKHSGLLQRCSATPSAVCFNELEELLLTGGKRTRS